MSLAEIEAYERDRQRRRKKFWSAVSWIPPGIAVLMLTGGGLSLWSASSDHDTDRAEVAALVNKRQTEAQEIEEEFHSAWSETLERSSEVRVERLENDSEAMHAWLEEIVVEGAPASAVLVMAANEEVPSLLEDMARNGIPGMDGASHANLGPFELVLVDIEDTTYGYFAFVAIYDADTDLDPTTALSVVWSTNTEGEITEIDAKWTEEPPKHS